MTLTTPDDEVPRKLISGLRLLKYGGDITDGTVGERIYWEANIARVGNAFIIEDSGGGQCAQACP